MEKTTKSSELINYLKELTNLFSNYYNYSKEEEKAKKNLNKKIENIKLNINLEEGEIPVFEFPTQTKSFDCVITYKDLELELRLNQVRRDQNEETTNNTGSIIFQGRGNRKKRIEDEVHYILKLKKKEYEIVNTKTTRQASSKYERQYRTFTNNPKADSLDFQLETARKLLNEYFTTPFNKIETKEVSVNWIYEKSLFEEKKTLHTATKKRLMEEKKLNEKNKSKLSFGELLDLNTFLPAFFELHEKVYSTIKTRKQTLPNELLDELKLPILEENKLKPINKHIQIIKEFERNYDYKKLYQGMKNIASSLKTRFEEYTEYKQLFTDIYTKYKQIN